MDGGARKMVFSTFPRAESRLQVRAQKRAEVLMWLYRKIQDLGVLMLYPFGTELFGERCRHFSHR